MDFGIIYQLKIKKVWWVDVILYFVIALLLAVIICYLIFNIKISFQERQLKKLEEEIAATNTGRQKEIEEEVFGYQRKISDFASLFTAHKSILNFFGLLEELTLPNVWFYNFDIDSKENRINVTGEAESMAVLARQIEILEENEFIDDISTLNFEAKANQIKFALTILLNHQIFVPVEKAEEVVPPAPPS